METEFLNSENIAQIAAEFWNTMPSVALSVVHGLREPAGMREGISGRIEIRGAWVGEVELRASRRLAEQTAANLLEKLPGEVSIEECFDAVQEATNIVAGGIKHLLPPICRMAVPSMSGCSDLLPKNLRPQDILAFFSSSAGELSVLVRPNR
jgi:hypothetical protein